VTGGYGVVTAIGFLVMVAVLIALYRGNKNG
jgi:hypothetical protein